MQERSRAVGAIALAFGGLLWATALSPHYGFYSDELYYLACAERPALGYVDQPPLFLWLLGAHRALFGDSLFALRALPAAAGAAAVFLTGDMTRRMGGGAWAQAIAPLAFASGVSLVMFGFFSVNCLGILWWTAAAWIAVELCRTRDPRWWAALGIVAGVGFLTKHTMLVWTAALGVGLLASPARRDWRGPWPWLGAGAFAAIAAPNVWWQVAHGWPSLSFYARRATTDLIGPGEVVVQQILVNGPAAFPVWAAGLIFLLAHPAGRRFRPLGVAFACAFAAAMIAGQPTPYRIAGAYPVALAAGAVLLERARRPGAGWIRRAWDTWTLPAALGALGLLAASFALPILPPSQMLAHPLWDGDDGWRVNVGEKRLPYHLGNRIHWRDVAAAVDRAVATLGPEERAGAVVLADYFGHAGALEYYRPDGLPVYSPMTGYALFGPPPGATPVVVAIGIDEAFLDRHFGRVDEAARFTCALCPAWQDDLPIHVARAPRRSVERWWRELVAVGGRDLYRRRRAALESTGAEGRRAPARTEAAVAPPG